MSPVRPARPTAPGSAVAGKRGRTSARRYRRGSAVGVRRVRACRLPGLPPMSDASRAGRSRRPRPLPGWTGRKPPPSSASHATKVRDDQDHELAGAVPAPGRRRGSADFLMDGEPVRGARSAHADARQRVRRRRCIAWIFTDADLPGRLIDAAGEPRLRRSSGAPGARVLMRNGRSLIRAAGSPPRSPSSGGPRATDAKDRADGDRPHRLGARRPR